jgi:hypothetical protein
MVRSVTPDCFLEEWYGMVWILNIARHIHMTQITLWHVPVLARWKIKNYLERKMSFDEIVLKLDDLELKYYLR